MRIGITGSGGFIGSNLLHRLLMMPEHEVVEIPKGIVGAELSALVDGIEVLFHIAGVNRPEREEEFAEGNADYTGELLGCLERDDSSAQVVLTSSTQAVLDNPYGRSKKEAENLLRAFSERTSAGAVIYRLPNVFGKWSRPNYNSVVSTFCHNTAVGKELTVSDPDKAVTLVYVDDIIDAFVRDLEPVRGVVEKGVEPEFLVTLGDLAALVASFPEIRASHRVPDMGDPFVKRLYSTYLSYLEPDSIISGLQRRTDDRGSLVELIKSDSFGQMFYSTTKPGITRGNHFHHLKIERFFVLSGECCIKLRNIRSGEIRRFDVDARDDRYVEIPPGFTHSVTNTGETELVMLFWANEIFDADRPDTYFKEVQG